ncbi:MAG: heme ABC transporter ATP-binding protein [Candidatus Methanofastidiosa archaeon]|nr:heme ABC transporter ATP-binding protein [Candidatus Methanofastidiosa archaeon]
MGINIDELKFAYKDKEVLKSIGFDTHRGEMVALLGPNGSGKTTLLKILAKILCPDCGIINIDNRGLEGITPKELAKEMAVIPQSFDTTFSFTAHDIVLMGRTPHLSRWGSEKERDFEVVRGAMEKTNTWQFKDKLFYNLSGGEKQRVIIARALAQEPHILLLDEPTSSLDINHQIEILATVRSLVDNENMMVIAAFHDLNMAAKYFDRILLLHNGEVYADGPPERVITEENIKEVFGVDVVVKNNPITDSLYVVPMAKACVRKSKPRERVHLICGGGSGSSLLNKLDQDKYDISVGVLNMLDSDQETAEYMKIDKMVLEAPFSPISYENHMKNIALIKDSSILILSDFSIGSGNLMNLEAALIALRHKIPVLMLDKRRIEEKDFTDGRATKIHNELLDNGALTFTSKRELLYYCKMLLSERLR